MNSNSNNNNVGGGGGGVIKSLSRKLTQQEKYEREIQEIQEKQKREIQEIQERQKREIQERQEKHERENKQKKEEIQERQEKQEKQKEDAEEMLREEILTEEGMREQMQQFLQHRNIDVILKMMKCYDENVNKPTLTRHTYKTIYILYGVYTNRKVKYYDTHYSLSGFGKAHKKIIKGQSSVPRFTETNGWTECEIRNEEGEWVKLK
jgi:hypothetical protein